MQSKWRTFREQHLSIVLTLGFFAGVILLATFQSELRALFPAAAPGPAMPESSAANPAPAAPAPTQLAAREAAAPASSGAANPSAAPAPPAVARQASPSAAPVPLETNVAARNAPTAPPANTNRPAAAPASLPTVIRLGANPASLPAGAIDPARIQIIDSDTVRIDGQTFSLAGIDTPESGFLAKCERERELAARATRRLREIVAAGGLRLDRVACPCPVGTEGTLSCNYGRLCGVLTSGGRDVGLILIGEGLARRYNCAGTECPPRPGWC